MRKLTREQKQEISMVAKKKDEDIDFSDISLVLDWSGAEVGKFYHPTENLTQAEIKAIRRDVQQGIDEIERGEGTTYEGTRGLAQFFREIEAQGRKELAAERKKKAKS